MCGIAGIVRFDNRPISDHRLATMLEQLRHRGPDGEGVVRKDHCALAHTRLSIIDLGGGDQPMHTPSSDEQGPLTIVFNGEIYNHRALRKQLESTGHVFHSNHSDTEVLLWGYRQWGKRLPERLEGMFAFAIWDRVQRQLFLCRDRIGKKPLYLRWSDDRSEISFASLVATLVASDEGERKINRQALLDYLRLGYTHSESLIEGIEELVPAHWMLIDPSGRVQIERYWQQPPVTSHPPVTDALEATGHVIDEAVRARLESDVPLGCFLSGGIDSSIIATLAQRARSKNGDRLKTFSVAMPELDYDESHYAMVVARHIGSDHQSLTAQPNADIIGDLEHLIALSGEPTADSSILPTYWLSRATRQFVKVALSGDGGDELFAGYDRYRALRMLTVHRWWLNKLPAGLLNHHNPRTVRARLSRLVTAAGEQHPSGQYRRMIELFNEPQIRELGAYEADTPPLHDWPDQIRVPQAAMHWDLAHYLPNNLLRKMDRASMAVALEVRCPLLDTRVCDLASQLPESVLMPNGRPKGLLRQLALRLRLPKRIVNRPKRGFAVPIGRWFYDQLRDPLRDRLFDGSLESLGLNHRFIQRLFDEHDRRQADHTHRLFGLMTLSIWVRLAT